MSDNPKKVIDLLNEKIETDLKTFTNELTQEMRKLTPVQTGRAKRGWRQKTPRLNGGKTAIIENRVPYSGVLDTGSSRQAPKGMVEPAVEKVLRRRR